MAATLPLRFELFHYVQEVIVDLRVLAKLVLDLVQVGEGILNFEPLELLCPRTVLASTHLLYHQANVKYCSGHCGTN